MPIKISVVIPVYNVEKYIRQCVDSVIGQTLQDIEIILVDDGSPDQSGMILDLYAENDKRVRVIHKENGGVSAARNDGMKICRGKYLYIMDSDDYLSPDALEILYDEAERSHADVVIADHYTFTEDGKILPHHFFSREFVTEDRKLILSLQEFTLHSGYSPYPTKENKGLGIAAPWTKLITRELAEKNHLRFDSYVRGIFDDGLFSLAVFQSAGKVSYIRQQVYYYRILETSLIHRFSPDRMETDQRIFKRIRQFSKKNNSGPMFRKAYYARVVWFMMHLFVVYFFNEQNTKDRMEIYKEFRQLFKKKVYAEAIRNVEVHKLKKEQQAAVMMAKCHMYPFMWAALRIILR